MSGAEWVRHGECNNCGFCCQTISRDVMVRTDDHIARDPDFYWARGFRPMVVDGERRHVLFAWLQAPCPQHVDQMCAIHYTKPRTCREFPRLPVDIIGTPCSYWFSRGNQRAGGESSPHPISPTDFLAMERYE